MTRSGVAQELRETGDQGTVALVGQLALEAESLRRTDAPLKSPLCYEDYLLFHILLFAP